MCTLDPGQAELSDTEKTSQLPAATSGASREQLIVFLADTLRGTVEERAPLVLAMSHNAADIPKYVTYEQVFEVNKGGNYRGNNKTGISEVYFFCIFPPVSTGPDFCSSSDSNLQGASSGLAS